MKFVKWHFRNNKRRKQLGIRKGKHPSLVFAKSDDEMRFYNLGLTHSRKRGHHKNIEIHNPQNWEEVSYIRNDISVDDKQVFSGVLNNYRLHPYDYGKIWNVIVKKKIKNLFH
ncbi:MAG: hypothetical protein IJR08_04935 [Bacilli bacterium]|nr:hypothetical protein [Bacilli bacterium]